MEPASKVHNRTPMTCPFCLSPEKILSTHLRRKCMKFNSGEEIKAVLAQAKKALVNIASKGTILDYQEIMSLGSLDNVAPFLETRGFVIVNKPTVARNVQQEHASRSASSVISLPQCPVNAAEDHDDAIPGQADLEGDLTLFPQSPTEEIEVSETPEDPGENQIDGEEGREYEECTAEVEEEQFEEMENEETQRSGQQEDRSSTVSSVVTLPQCTTDAAVELKDAIPGQVEMEAAKEVEDEQSEESETEETFDEDTQRVLQTKWSTDTRKKMKIAGLYKRHSTREPILMGFSQYLQKSLKVTHYKQEVQDVGKISLLHERTACKFGLCQRH
ncbi:uncharacterized protein [Dendrobates tinctorius]|uniref:uncharacterized protein n=1 Tax=Dendrobates tinctorius TaxID=92724 RepID=UPI003CC9D670